MPKQGKQCRLKVLLCASIWAMFCNSDKDKIVLYFLTITTYFDVVGFHDLLVKLIFLGAWHLSTSLEPASAPQIQAEVEALVHQLQCPHLGTVLGTPVCSFPLAVLPLLQEVTLSLILIHCDASLALAQQKTSN